MAAGAALHAHGLGVLAPTSARILTRILVRMLNVLLGQSERFARVQWLLGWLEVFLYARADHLFDSPTFRSKLADWLNHLWNGTPRSRSRPSDRHSQTDVAATLVLSPVLKPVENGLHTLEVVGIVVGLVTGLHPLVIACAKHLAHDEFGSTVATGIKQAIQSPGAQALDDKLPVTACPRSLADSVVAEREPVQPQRATLPTIRSFGDRPITNMTDCGVREDLSPEAIRTIRMTLEAIQQALSARCSPPTSTTASVEVIE